MSAVLPHVPNIVHPPAPVATMYAHTRYGDVMISHHHHQVIRAPFGTGLSGVPIRREQGASAESRTNPLGTAPSSCIYGGKNVSALVLF